jgi:hypothetical protein
VALVRIGAALAFGLGWRGTVDLARAASLEKALRLRSVMGWWW